MNNSSKTHAISHIIGGIIVHTTSISQARDVAQMVREEELRKRITSGSVTVNQQTIYWEKLYDFGT